MTHSDPSNGEDHHAPSPSPADPSFQEHDIEGQSSGDMDDGPDPPANPGGYADDPPPSSVGGP